MNTIHNFLKLFKLFLSLHRIGEVRVVVYPSADGGWIAQGLEIDYTAQGESLEEAKQNFSEGLDRTLVLNYAETGTIDGILNRAPDEFFELFDTVENAKEHANDRVLLDLRPSVISYPAFSHQQA